MDIEILRGYLMAVREPSFSSAAALADRPVR